MESEWRYKSFPLPPRFLASSFSGFPALAFDDEVRLMVCEARPKTIGKGSFPFPDPPRMHSIARTRCRGGWSPPNRRVKAVPSEREEKENVSQGEEEEEV